MQSSFDKNEKNINVKPSIRNKSEQVSLLSKIPKSCKNATTLKTALRRNVNTQKCNYKLSSMTRKSKFPKVDKYVDLAFPSEDKCVQYQTRSQCKNLIGKNATSRTKHSLKSTESEAKSECRIQKPKISVTQSRPGCIGRPSSSSRYHEKCVLDYYYRYTNFLQSSLIKMYLFNEFIGFRDC